MCRILSSITTKLNSRKLAVNSNLCPIASLPCVVIIIKLKGAEVLRQIDGWIEFPGFSGPSALHPET